MLCSVFPYRMLFWLNCLVYIFFYLWFPCLVFIIARMVQNQFVLVLVKSSSFFSYSNTASGEFAVHQWTWHMQGWQVLDENVHIGEVPENVGTGDIWKKIWKLKKKSSHSWPKQWKLNPTKKYAICIKSCTTLPSKTDTFATLTEVLKQKKTYKQTLRLLLLG